MQNKFTAIIQLRNNSSRLKNKHLLEVNKLPIINFLYQTLDSIECIERIIFSTSQNKEDDSIEDYCKKKSYEFFFNYSFSLCWLLVVVNIRDNF